MMLRRATLIALGVSAAAFTLCTATFAQTPAGPTIAVATVGSFQPAVTVDADTGRFFVVWSNNGLRGSRFDRDGAPLGASFRIDPSPGLMMSPTAATNKDGAVFVAWRRYESREIHGRAYDREGAPRGPEFRVDSNGPAAMYPTVASLANGGFVVVWARWGYGGGNTLLGRRFDSGGRPLGLEFEVGHDLDTWYPTVAGGRDGSFLVLWPSASEGDLWARRYAADGQPGQPQVVATSDYRIAMNSAAAIDDGYVVVWSVPFSDNNARLVDLTGRPRSDVIRLGPNNWDFPFVGADETGAFTVARTTVDDPTGYFKDSVLGRRFTASGLPREAEFLIAHSDPWDRIWQRASVAVDPVGNAWVSWQDVSNPPSHGTFVQRYGGLLPAGAVVDTVAGPRSDGNGVLEPGEAVDLQTSWRNVNGAAQTFSGTLANANGPGGATYAITDGVGDYGTVPNGEVRACTDCFGLRVSPPATRPVLHWDATAEESIAPDAQGQHKRWRLHVGDSFSDVPRTSPYYRSVETLLHKGITSGCGGASFCAQSATSREQMAALLLLSKEGSTYKALCRASVFADVSEASPFCPFIEELARRGITGGCGGGNFCPEAPVAREQMAVFLLRTLDPTLDPPACGTPVFADVPASSPFCRWIEELARRGIATGCGGGNFCPTASVTREQMAVFLTQTFSLRLY